MDFFDHQEQARKKSGALVFYFILAVIGIILSIYLVVTGVSLFMGDEITYPGDRSLWNLERFLYSGVITTLVVLAASAFKAAQLSGGGAVVARELGGRELSLTSRDFHERRLLNVVEEMAIASGVPVPTVYVMDQEDSINAFAAGKTTSDAVIGVTRGCMTLLTRDELQGVIAHEFSHILNGDMRLNIRLMAMLFGILFLALIGEMVMRAGFRTTSVRSRDNNGGGALALIVIGLAILVIGYVGNFFASLIKASISRQREFLADASAVQFTRNPDGLANALMKVGGYSQGSTIDHPMAKDCSHLFFSNSLHRSLMATHPPLETRITRLQPSWSGKFSKSRLEKITADSDHSTQSDSTAAVSMLSGNESSVALNPPEVIESFKTLHPEQVELGHAIHQNLPEHWIDACHSNTGARAVVYALLLAQDDTLRSTELQHLRQSCEPAIAQVAEQLFPELSSLHSAIKFSLIDLSIPTLRQLSYNEYQAFKKIANEIIASDQQVDLFEFALLKIIERHLDTYFEFLGPPSIKFRTTRGLTTEASIILSVLAAMSHDDGPESIQSAFQLAATHLAQNARTQVEFLSAAECGLSEFAEALEKFQHATPPVKRTLLEAASLSVLQDETVSSREAEVIRAVADAIASPIPPIIKTAPIG